jgi:hypothetical protein
MSSGRKMAIVVLVVLVLGTIAGAAGTRYGVGGSLLLSAIAALAVLAVLDHTVGLAMLLVLMPLDRSMHPMLQHLAWYPRYLHPVDPIAVGLIAGFLVRVLTRRVRLEWRWYDGVYLAFMALLAASAAHGLLDHYRYVLREGRPIFWLLAYFPSREVVSRFRREGRHIEPLVLGYGIAYCLIAFVFAYLARPEFGRARDVVLPRLPFVVDVIPLVLLVLVGLKVHVRPRAEREVLRLAVVALLVYGAALSIANTRSLLLGLVVAAGAYVALQVSQRQIRWAQLGPLSVAVGLLLVGMAIPYGLRVALVHVENQNPNAPTANAAPEADPMVDGEVRAAQVPTLAPMPVTEITRVGRLSRGQDENWENRMREVRTAWRDAKSHPLGGVGLGLPVVFTRLEWNGKSLRVQQSFLHSGYFAVLRSAGVLGLLGLLAVIGSFIAVAFRGGARRDPVVLTGALGLIALLPIIQLANVVFMPGAVWLAAVLAWIGSLAPAAGERERAPSPVLSGVAGK